MMRKLLLRVLALVAALGFVATPAQAGLMTVAYDGFNYGDSTLGSQNGGTGWGGAWSNSGTGSFGTLSTSSTGLTYPGLATTGGSAYSTNGNNSINYNTNARSLSAEINSLNTSVAYIQFLSNWTETPRAAGSPNLRLYDHGVREGGIGNNGGANMAILGSNLQPIAGGTSSTSMNQLDLTIVEINYTTDTTSMWVNPALASFNYQNPPNPDVSVSGFAPAFDGFTLIMRAGSFDELTVMADPLTSAPEPATLTMLGIGIASIAGYGWRRRKASTSRPTA